MSRGPLACPPTPVIVSEADLREFAERLLIAAGAPAPKASLVADAVVTTNLRGLDSHGLQLLPYYIGQIERGDVDPHAEGRVASENGACMVYDAEHGLGQVTAPICCAHAVRLSAGGGIGVVISRESNHFGAAGLWSGRISAAGRLGIVMCDASMQVPPWQGRQQRLGTNPISVSVPHPGGRGWLLDMATTTVAYGKIEQAFLKGEKSIPHGWALDSEGVPTTDTETALKSGMLMPLGGYKGSGLAMMVEILCGVLGGGPVFGTGVTGVRHHGRATHANQTFIAIDVTRFMPIEEFHARMDWLVAEVKSAQPARGYQEVLVAGDPEWRAEEHRRRHGIPIQPGVWRTVAAVAERLNVALPAFEQAAG